MDEDSKFFLPGPASDSAYENIRDCDSFKSDKLFLENLWQRFKPFADSNFLKEAKTNFQERFWEMYLANTLMEHGFDLKKHGNHDHGPDLNFDFNDSKVWIEAIAPRRGEGPDAVPELRYSNEEVPEEKMILRFTSAIDAKKKQFEKYVLDGIVSRKDKQIIAINGRTVMGVPHVYGNPPYIVKCLIGQGPFNATYESGSGRRVDSGYEHRPNIAKKSKTQIPTEIFLDKNNEAITGIFYSCVDMLNPPPKFGDEFLFIHNPFATNPLPKNLFKFGTEYWVEGSELKNHKHH